MDQHTSDDPDQDLEQSTGRPTRAGETGTTRADMDDGADTDGEGTGGMVDKKDAGGGEPAGDGTSSGVTR